MSTPRLPFPFALESVASPGVVPLRGSWERAPRRVVPVTADQLAATRELAVLLARPEGLAGDLRLLGLGGPGECVCWDYENPGAPCTCGARE